MVQGLAKIRRVSQAFGQREEKSSNKKYLNMILNPVLHGSFLFTNSQFSQLRGCSLQLPQIHYFGAR